MKTELDAKDIFKREPGDTSSASQKETLPDQPTEQEMQEAASPYLSSDEFSLSGRVFKIRMSNIKTQKIMAKSLDAITDFIKKLDIKPLVETLVDKLNRKNNFIDQMADIAKSQETEEEKQKRLASAVKDAADSSDDTSTFIDMIDMVREVITHGGISNIVEMILDLYTGVVYAICNSQDRSITKEWIEENLNFAEADSIFFRQMQKDRMGGKVIDFLSVLTRQVIKA